MNQNFRFPTKLSQHEMVQVGSNDPESQGGSGAAAADLLSAERAAAADLLSADVSICT